MTKILYMLGRYHCRKGMKPILNFKSYLNGYSFEYELEQRLDYEV